MVTWPANMPAPTRVFVSRQVELREKLRWAPLGSKRRKTLESELAKVVLEELRREAVRTEAAPSEDGNGREPWWDK